jgi:hypothetical protein
VYVIEKAGFLTLHSVQTAALIVCLQVLVLLGGITFFVDRFEGSAERGTISVTVIILFIFAIAGIAFFLFKGVKMVLGNKKVEVWRVRATAIILLAGST